jgi:hypothetical protein
MPTRSTRRSSSWAPRSAVRRRGPGGRRPDDARRASAGDAPGALRAGAGAELPRGRGAAPSASGASGSSRTTWTIRRCWPTGPSSAPPGRAPLRPRRDGHPRLGRRLRPARRRRLPRRPLRPAPGAALRRGSGGPDEVAGQIEEAFDSWADGPHTASRSPPGGVSAAGRWWSSTGPSRPRARSASPDRRTVAVLRCSSPPRW